MRMVAKNGKGLKPPGLDEVDSLGISADTVLFWRAQDLLADSNPMVVANAVAALADIRDTSGAGGAFTLSSQSLFKLLRALNECTEWGQVRARLGFYDS